MTVNGVGWLFGRKSETCTIDNEYGVFRFVAYELLDHRSAQVTVCAMLTPLIADGALLRLNSACITSEVFGDKACDCRWQLEHAFKRMAASENGIILYAPFEEGRGSGIFAKIDALAHAQRTGCTSSEAFSALGHPVDTRTYGYAPIILRDLGIGRVNCLTNNPHKIKSLEAGGIVVEYRFESVARHRGDLKAFLLDKRLSQGHQIDWSDE